MGLAEATLTVAIERHPIVRASDIARKHRFMASTVAKIV